MVPLRCPEGFTLVPNSTSCRRLTVEGWVPVCPNGARLVEGKECYIEIPRLEEELPPQRRQLREGGAGRHHRQQQRNTETSLPASLTDPVTDPEELRVVEEILAHFNALEEKRAEADAAQHATEGLIDDQTLVPSRDASGRKRSSGRQRHSGRSRRTREQKEHKKSHSETGRWDTQSPGGSSSPRRRLLDLFHSTRFAPSLQRVQPCPGGFDPAPDNPQRCRKRVAPERIVCPKSMSQTEGTTEPETKQKSRIESAELFSSVPVSALHGAPKRIIAAESRSCLRVETIPATCPKGFTLDMTRHEARCIQRSTIAFARRRRR